MSTKYEPRYPDRHNSPEFLERLARKRAGAKLGWFIHAAVFVCVNVLLLIVSLVNGKHWAFFPLAGWGLGLAIHGALVWFGSSGSALHEHLLHRERKALAAQRETDHSPL